MTTTGATSLRLTRRIAAEPQEVFDAWTQPDHLLRWSCPEAATIEDAQVDLTVGGSYVLNMKTPDGQAHTAFGTYREIDSPRRLVYTWDWKEAEFAVGESVVTVEFRGADGGTEVVLAHEGFPAKEAMEGHRDGWASCLVRLEGLFA